jgi:hypothetical protein
MSTDQFDPDQVVRIKMSVVYVDMLGGKSIVTVHSGRLARRLAEMDVALGPEHLSYEHAAGCEVRGATIVPWTFD